MGLSRLEAFAAMGKVQVVEPLAREAHREREEAIWRGDLEADPHGEPWHLSTHASQFPGDDQRHCIRRDVYELANFPNVEPASRMLHGTALVGKAIEADLVERLDWSGRIVSAPAHAERQTRFEDADHWHGGSPDLVILPYRWNRLHVVEVKTKDHDVILDMKNGLRRWDFGHRLQCLDYIGLGHEISPAAWPRVVICDESWRLAEFDGGEYFCREHNTAIRIVDGGCLRSLELEPLRTGSVYYHSRNRPNVTHEYFFELDVAFMARGREILRQALAHFQAGQIPPHPFDGKEWSKLPCQFCDLKKPVCKPDHQAKITALADSHGVGFASEVRGGYDFEATSEAVTSRWENKSGVYMSEVP